MLQRCIILLFICCFTTKSRAQFLKNLFKVNTDTSYVSEHDNDLTVRPYLEHNFNQYKLKNTRTNRTLVYQPNAPLQLGLGLSYRIIGIGLGFALPYVNKYNKYGKGSITDFSSHFHLRRMTFDVYYQYYSGQHLHDPEKNLNDWTYNDTYRRQDITTKVLGVGFQYLLNPKPFSMEPLSFVHYQKKSAGSFVIGMHVIRTGIYGDSSIVPAGLNNDILDGFLVTRSYAWNFSLNVGYAYTVVYKKHFFLTAALNAGTGVSTSEMDGYHIIRKTGTGILLNAVARLAIGYNSEYFFTGLQYVGYTGYNQTPLPDIMQQYNIGRINFTVAQRFKLKKKLLGFY